MIALIQIIRSGSVSIFGKPDTERSSEFGLSIFLGVDKNDTSEEVSKLANKVAKLRIFPDKEGKMNLDSISVSAKIFAISQFTLLGDCKGNNRPDFSGAARKDHALILFNEFVSLLEGFELSVTKGYFGEHMNITQNLDGPVTIILDSNKL